MEPTKDIIKRFVEELWNARRLDVADQIFSEDCVTHQLRSGVSVEPTHREPYEMKDPICLAAKRTAGYGWSTRGCGSQRSPNASVRVHENGCFWLRRRSLRHHSASKRWRNAARLSRFPGTA